MSQPSAPITSLSPELTAQHEALSQRCGLLDRSERGKLALTGSGAAEFLNGQVTNDVLSLSAGEGCYAAFLTHKGKMLGDLRILLTQSELLLDTERACLQSLFDMIRRFKIGYDVELHKRTLERGLLSLIGPNARAILRDAIEANDAPDTPLREVSRTAPDTPLREVSRTAPAAHTSSAAHSPHAPFGELSGPEHAHVTAQIAGVEVRLIATAQPEGVDVLCDSASTERVKQALLIAGAKQVEEDAVEIVRVERGRPRYGVDLDDGVIPQEAGLNERAVSFTKGCYVGQETVARLHYKGKPNRHLRGLHLSSPVPSGAELHLDGKIVGHLTSSVISPVLGPIGLSLLRREAEPGAKLTVGDQAAQAEVVSLPFPD